MKKTTLYGDDVDQSNAVELGVTTVSGRKWSPAWDMWIITYLTNVEKVAVPIETVNSTIGCSFDILLENGL